MNSVSKKVTSSFAWKITERIVSRGISLIVQIILARILLPSDFGSLAIIVSITNYALLFVQSGLSTALIRKKEIDQGDVSTVLTASLVVAFIMYSILFLLSPFLSLFFEIPELVWPIRVLSLILFLNAINGVQSALLARKFKFKQILIKSLISVPLSGIIGVIMAYMGFGIWSLIAQNMIGILLTVVVMLFGLDYKLRIGFNWKKAKSLYAFGGKILFTNLINGLYDASRTLAIGKKYNSESLAYYDKANTYTYYIDQIVNSSMASVLLPTFSQYQDDEKKLCEMARRSVKTTSFIMIPILFGCASISGVLIPLLLTDKWSACIPYFIIFCFIRIPEIIKTIDIQVYYSLGKSGLHLFYSIVMCVLSLISLSITIFISIRAVAIGALIVEYASLIFVSIISSKTYGYKIISRLKDIAKPVINSLIMAMLVYFVSYFGLHPIFTLVLQVVIGIVIYLILSFITRDRSLQEITFLIKSMKGKKNE